MAVVETIYKSIKTAKALDYMQQMEKAKGKKLALQFQIILESLILIDISSILVFGIQGATSEDLMCLFSVAQEKLLW